MPLERGQELRRFDAATEPVRQAVIAVQLAVAVGVAWAALPALAAAAVTVVAIVLVAWVRMPPLHEAAIPDIPRADTTTPTEQQAVA